MSDMIGAFSVFKCSICDQVLQEETRNLICTFCGSEEEGEWVCPEGHYVCESCRLASPAEAVTTVCLKNSSGNPVTLANLIMHHPSFQHHGPEHHIVTAPVILSALSQTLGKPMSESRLQAILKATEDIPKGTCYNRGDCGACAGVGAVIAFAASGILTAEAKRTRSLQATAQSLLHLASMQGHRCCKQSVYASLETAYTFLRNELNLSLPSFPEKISCLFFEKITDCKKEQCPYYPIERTLKSNE